MKKLPLYLLPAALALIICTVWAEGASIPVMTIAYESSGEPFDGQVAVAKVIINRAKQRGLSEDEVSLQKGQFSCWKDGKATQVRQLSAKELKVAEMAYMEAKSGMITGVDEANLYCRWDCRPYWREKVEYLGRIGSHLFFKE